jgi:hypothetical protein
VNNSAPTLFVRRGKLAAHPSPAYNIPHLLIVEWLATENLTNESGELVKSIDH